MSKDINLNKEYKEVLKEKTVLERKLAKIENGFNKAIEKNEKTIEQLKGKIEKSKESIVEHSAKYEEKLSKLHNKNLELKEVILSLKSEKNEIKSQNKEKFDNEYQNRVETKKDLWYLKKENKELLQKLNIAEKMIEEMESPSIQAALEYNKKDLRALYNQTEAFIKSKNEQNKNISVYQNDFTGRNDFAHLDTKEVVNYILTSNPILLSFIQNKNVSFDIPDEFFSTNRLSKAFLNTDEISSVDYLNNYKRKVDLENDMLYIVQTNEKVFLILT